MKSEIRISDFDANLQNRQGMLDFLTEIGILGISSENNETLWLMCKHLNGSSKKDLAEKPKANVDITKKQKNEFIVKGDLENEKKFIEYFAKFFDFSTDFEIVFLQKGVSIYQIFKFGRRAILSYTYGSINKDAKIKASLNFNGLQNIDLIDKYFPDYKVVPEQKNSNLPTIRQVFFEDLDSILNLLLEDDKTTIIEIMKNNLKKFKN